MKTIERYRVEYSLVFYGVYSVPPHPAFLRPLTDYISNVDEKITDDFLLSRILIHQCVLIIVI